MRYVIAGLIVLGLAGCSKSPEQMQKGEALSTFDVAEAPPAQPAPLVEPPGIVAPQTSTTPATTAPAPISVSVPQMAYSYSYAYRLPGDAIGRAQDAHVALCDRLGPSRCQILSLANGTGEGAAATASLKLRVASSIARAFGRQLGAAIQRVGGRSVSAGITAEDVSKDIVDTEARLRQRTMLVERLTEILRTRNGKVAELVEAERSVAAAQEEIDQAKGWLAELRGRVAMSTVTIEYQAVAADVAPQRSAIGDAIAQSSGAFVAGIGAVATLAIFLLPWALIAGLAWFGWRRWRARRSDDAPPEPS